MTGGQGRARGLAARVRDVVLGGADGSSLLAMSMSVVAELLEIQIDATADSGVYC
jgi:hypothetical protein